MIKAINAWIIYRRLKVALFVYGPGADILPPEKQAEKINQLRQDLRAVYRYKLINRKQYDRLSEMFED